jgi:large subunit ribosomal protein L17
MKKKVFGRKLKRDVNERNSLFKGLMSSLILHEKIETTEEKAKSIRASVEKLVTKAKKSGDQAYHFIQPHVYKEAGVKLVQEIGPRFQQRNGGYTRIIKIGRRLSDNAAMVVMEWVDKKADVAIVKSEEKAKPVKKVKTEKTVVESEVKTEKEKVVKKPAKKAEKDTKRKTK